MAMFNPPHPAGLITEYLKEFGISLRSLARDLGVTPSSLSKIATGKSAISPEMAVRFEACLGISARLWLVMQAAYDSSKARETSIHSLVNEDLKMQNETILHDCALTISTALRLFAENVVQNASLPFEITRQPSVRLRESMRQAEAIIADGCTAIDKADEPIASMNEGKQ